MIRTLWVVVSISCVTLLLSEALGVALLWSQGTLSSRRLREIRDLFGPQEKEGAVTFRAGHSPPFPPRKTFFVREACGFCRWVPWKRKSVS